MFNILTLVTKMIIMGSRIPNSRIITSEKEATRFLSFLSEQNPAVILEHNDLYSPSSLIKQNLLEKVQVYSPPSFPSSSNLSLIVIVQPLSYPIGKQFAEEIRNSVFAHLGATDCDFLFILDAWTKMWAKGLSEQVIEIVDPNLLIAGRSLKQVSILARTLQLEEDAFNATFDSNLSFTMQHRVAKNLAPGLHKPLYKF